MERTAIERIELNYSYRTDNGEEKFVTMSKQNEDSLCDYDICRMFIDFMDSVGFSKENVLRNFRE